MLSSVSLGHQRHRSDENTRAPAIEDANDTNENRRSRLSWAVIRGEKYVLVLRCAHLDVCFFVVSMFLFFPFPSSSTSCLPSAPSCRCLPSLFFFLIPPLPCCSFLPLVYVFRTYCTFTTQEVEKMSSKLRAEVV